MKRKTITAAFLAVGMLASVGYGAIAEPPAPTTGTDHTNLQDSAAPVNRTDVQDRTAPVDRTNVQDRTAPQTVPQNRSTTPNRANVSAADRQFAIKAAQGGMAEVQLSQIAIQRANSEGVREFARMMVEEHTRVNNQLMELASSKGITLPREMDAQHKQVAAQLRQLSGANFDRAYMNVMVRDHAATVALFQNEVRQGRDGELKDFASGVLPSVQQHYAMASNMTRNMAAR